jgi:hypothetical protein
MSVLQREPAPLWTGATDELPLVDLLDRLLERGAALSGDLVVSVAGVDLVRLGLRALLQGIDDSAQEKPQSGEAQERRERAAPPSRALDHGERPLTAGSPPPVRTQRPGRSETRATARAPQPGARRGPREPLAPVETLGSRRADERISFDPDDVQRGLAQLVLTLVELLREVLERQALRRVESTSLGDADVERLGRAFLELEARMDDLKAHFGLTDRDLKLGLGVVRDAG